MVGIAFLEFWLTVVVLELLVGEGCQVEES